MYICEERPTFVKQRSTFVKRGPRSGKAMHILEKRSIYAQRDLHLRKQMYTWGGKRPTFVKRDPHL